jgi:uncharacterized protein (TIRG00374 family)
MTDPLKNSSQSLFIPPLTVHIGRYLPRLVIMGLAVHLLLPQLTSLEHSIHVMKTMALWAVTLAAVAQLLSYAGSGYLLQSIIAIVQQRLSIRWGIMITLAASSIGLVAGGLFGTTAATYRWVRNRNISAEGAGLAGTLPAFLNNAILILIAVIGLIHLLTIHQLSSLQSFGFALFLLLLGLFIGGIIWGFYHRPQLISLVTWMTGIWDRIRHQPYTAIPVEDSMGRLFKALDALRTGGWRRPALGSLLNISFDMLTLYFLFVAAGFPVKAGVLLTGYGLPLLLGRMAFLVPGGVGVVEGTMAAMYIGLGVPDPITVVVILTYRLFSFWLPSLIGFPLVAYLQHLGNN